MIKVPRKAGEKSKTEVINKTNSQIYGYDAIGEPPSWIIHGLQITSRKVRVNERKERIKYSLETRGAI